MFAGVLETPSPTADSSFEDYAGGRTLRYLQLAALLMAGSTLLWWPTDPWVFRDEPEAQAVFSVTRPIVAAFGLATAVGCRALGSHPRFAPWLLLAGGAPPAFFLGWAYSSLGGLDGAWFYFAYFFPLLSILALCPLALRVVVASGLSMAYPLAYFVRQPHYVEDGRFVISISFLVFVVLVAVVIGHVIYRLVERQVEVQQELERRVAERTRALSRLSGHLTQSQETERRRVARDLHDEMGQLFTAMGLELGAARASGLNGEMKPAHDALQRLVDDGFQACRTLVESLRPRILDERGLVEALSWCCDQTRERSDLDVRFEVESEVAREAPRVSDEVAVTLFRSIQESLTNVARHARATKVDVTLEMQNGVLCLVVRDDGVGIDSDAAMDHGFGLLGIRERVRAIGGTFEALPAESRGTRVQVAVPLRAPTAEPRGT